MEQASILEENQEYWRKEVMDEWNNWNKGENIGENENTT